MKIIDSTRTDIRLLKSGEIPPENKNAKLLDDLDPANISKELIDKSSKIFEKSIQVQPFMKSEFWKFGQRGWFLFDSAWKRRDLPNSGQSIEGARRKIGSFGRFRETSGEAEGHFRGESI